MNKVFAKSVLWSVFGQVGFILVGLIGNIFLARLLSPTEFGQVGIAMVFIGVFGVLVDSGLSGALIRKKDLSTEDFSTVFIFNLGISISLYLLIILFAGTIADFYGDDQLELILIISGSILIINAFQIIKNTRLIIEMKFKKRAIYKFISLALASIIAISMAYSDFGVYAIVMLQVLSSLIFVIILWLFEKSGVDRLRFSSKSFKEMFSFGIYTTTSSLLQTFFDNIYQLILGKYFSVSGVGYFYQAKRLQDVADSVAKLVLLNVVYSHLSKLQDDLVSFRNEYTIISKLSAMLLGMVISFIFIYSEDIIRLLYGDKWLGAVFYLKVLALSSYFYLQEIVNRNIFKIFDQTQKILYLELIKKSIQTITIFIGLYYLDIEILLVGYLVTSILSYFINYFYSRSVIEDVTFLELRNLSLILFTGAISTGVTLLLYYEFQDFHYYRFAFFIVFLFCYLLGLKIFQIIHITSNEILTRLKSML